MLAKKLSLVLALCLLLAALVTAEFEAEGTKPVASNKAPPKGNPNNKMWRNTKPPTTKTPRPPKPHKSRTKPPSMQKPIKTPKPKPAKPEKVPTYKKCTAKYCTKLVTSLEKVVDETMQRCNATTCAVVDRWNKALLNKTINTYTPKTDMKDKKQEYCWVEYCRKASKQTENVVAKGQTACNAQLCPTFYSLVDWVRARYGSSAIPAPK